MHVLRDTALIQSKQEIFGIRHLSKAFGGVYALNDINLAIMAGEVHGLVGENGAGKSTLIKVLSGWITNYVGEVSVNGRVVHFAGPRNSETSGISTVYQELSNIDTLSVAENIFLNNYKVTRYGRIEWGELRKGARARLDSLGLTEVRVDDPLYVYPIGIKQLVEVARVLEKGTRIVILDEPTSALSEDEAERLLVIMKSLRDDGYTIIFVSQKLEQVFSVADTITVIRDGRIVLSQQRSELTEKMIISSMLGTELQSKSSGSDPCTELPQKPQPPLAPLVTFHNIGLSGRLYDVSLDIYPGECLALYGLMGAGHVEAGRLLYGLGHPDQGLIAMDGKPHHFADPVRAKAYGVGYLSEDRKSSLHLIFPVFRNLTLPFLPSIQKTKFTNNTQNELAVSNDLKQTFGIKAPSIFSAVQNLSGGNQQKTAIARWLSVPKVRLLVLQEPTRGVDVGSKAEISKVLKELKGEGMSLLLVTHEPETAIGLADRILVFSKGRVAAEFSGRKVCKSTLMGVE